MDKENWEFSIGLYKRRNIIKNKTMWNKRHSQEPNMYRTTYIYVYNTYLCECVCVCVFEGILRFNLDPFIINSEQQHKYFKPVTMSNEHFAKMPSTLPLLLCCIMENIAVAWYLWLCLWLWPDEIWSRKKMWESLCQGQTDRTLLRFQHRK